jgi:GNAT superfamily N-acetyltransferase
MTIRTLTEEDIQQTLDFANKHERENTFLIGSILRNRWNENVYIGAFQMETLVGVGVQFGRFKSVVVHGPNHETINALVDALVPYIETIGAVPDWRIYAEPTIERLKHHGFVPKVVSDQTMYLLTKDHYKGKSGEARLAHTDDIDNIIQMSRIIEGSTETRITDDDRAKIPTDMFYVRYDGDTLVSIAATHGFSDHYALLGGVGTHPKHRSKGYSKETVSGLAHHWLQRDKEVILFCANSNEPAKKVYTSIGFKPIGEFLHVTY